MRPSTLVPISHAQDTSTGTTDIVTFEPPAGASACYLTVRTTDAWVTFDGTDPVTGNGLLLTKALGPIRFDIAGTVSAASTAGANSIVDVLWLG